MLIAFFGFFDRLFASQWRCPHGPLGWVAGKLMERGNAKMNALGLQGLDVQAGDALLEVGFGPGAALERIAAAVGEGRVVGVDPSRTMIRQAARRLAGHDRSDRIELKEGTSSAIPYPDGTFDRVLTVNTIYFWSRPDEDFHELRRVTKPGGRLVVVFRGVTGSNGTLQVHGMANETMVQDVVQWMTEAGFGPVTEQATEAPFGPIKVTAIALTGVAQ